ncbi:helix-turn-helix domain-containing protein [Pedobacter sp. UYP1]|uniref:helix-turn-helix domain-containing protein n=1 Tax=Pedobacter sp. UYP1 TaxID=1756396 RepID=UPI0033967D88
MEPFNFDKLPEVVRQLFEKVEGIEALLKELQPKEENENELMTIQEAADFLKITVPALYAKVSRHDIPVNKPGRRLYFNKNELRKWIASSRKKTVIELRREAEERMKAMDKRRNFV